MAKNKFNKGEIVIYQTAKKEVDIRVRFEGETVWLKQDEISKLYSKERSVITKHINKIFADKEVDKKSNVHFLHIAGSDKRVAFYNLDVILAVGYRTNSARAIHFRKWATNVLKKYLLRGYAINEKRLLEAREKFKELQTAITFLQEKSKKELLSGQAGEILNLLSSYAKTLTLLDQYDKGKLKTAKGRKAKFVLKYEECQRIVKEIKKELIAKKEAGDIFGRETRGAFEGIVKGLYQTFNRKELYPTVEDKASHLLYFTIKDHPFTDGNKRIASFLLVYFLDKNNYLYRENGEKKINDNALTALALLIAESDPKEKDIMIKINRNLITE
ncbi:virulence protein RhuM/Fic/DOC family protein [candidate division WOR-3 bacterium]|nr:virulence protein RhuM/Fic/DOC family protein [candidate division WOR-3 bacterium]